MTQPKGYSFGYGSLVNRDTHAFTELYQARVTGWRRRWCHWVDAPFGACTSLTVLPDPHAEITGLVMGTPLAEHEALNAREKGYDRYIINQKDVVHSGPTGIEIELYQSRNQAPGNDDAPILQSYVDTVMQGFEKEFGPEGLLHFLENTDGWEAPILQDRANPIYPRTTPISDDDAYRYDDLLAGLRVRYITAR